MICMNYHDMQISVNLRDQLICSINKDSITDIMNVDREVGLFADDKVNCAEDIA